MGFWGCTWAWRWSPTSHAHCNANDCVCLQVPKKLLQGLQVLIRVSLDTRRSRISPARLRVGCMFPCGRARRVARSMFLACCFMCCFHFSCVTACVSRLSVFSENHRFRRFSESEARDPRQLPWRMLSCMQHSSCHARCTCSLPCRVQAYRARARSTSVPLRPSWQRPARPHRGRTGTPLRMRPVLHAIKSHVE